ncbi:MAG: hypothetical protein WD069_21050 [Planctomycetales bacterium]
MPARGSRSQQVAWRSLAAVVLLVVGASAADAPADDVAALPDPKTMQPGTWLAVPGSKMRAVCLPEGKFPVLRGSGGVGPHGIMDYSGGLFDTKRDRMIIWGGGHAGYAGNEIYAFDVGTMKWERLNEPSEPTNGRDTAPDGKPASRHTYNGLAYIAHADRMFGLGGSPCGSGNAVCQNTWIFDFDPKTWKNMEPAGTLPSAGYECNASYDPETKKVWWGNDAVTNRFRHGPGLFSYDYDANRWEKHDDFDFGYYISTIDTKRGLLVLMSCRRERSSPKNVFVYDIRNKDFTRKRWETTGGDEFLGSNKPGLAYDPVADRYVGWTGGAVYALDPESKKWTKHDPPGGPDRNKARQGIYGRWRYVPSVNAFIAAHSVDDDVHFFKLTAGMGER